MNILHIEDESMAVSSLISSRVSSMFKLKSILHFFTLIQSMDTSQNQSYYLEFSADFLNIIMQNSLDQTGPDLLNSILHILSRFQTDLACNVDAGLVSECRRHAQYALCRELMILGQWKECARLLENMTGEQIIPAIEHETEELQSTEGEVFFKLPRFTSLLKNRFPASLNICINLHREMTSAAGSYASDDTGILFVEKQAVPGHQNHAVGRILNISMKTALLPKTAEQHCVEFSRGMDHTDIRSEERLHQCFQAVAQHIGTISPGAANRHCCFVLSLPRNSSQLTGDSWGAGLALLAYCGMVNAYFGRPVVSLNRGVLVTGSVHESGRLLPVDGQGLEQKIEAAFFSPVSHVIVPLPNLPAASRVVDRLHSRYPHRNLAVESAGNIGQLIANRNIISIKRISLITRMQGAVHRLRHKSLFSIGAVLLILLPVLFLLPRFIKDRNPVSFRTVGSRLAVSNTAGDLLWTHDFGRILENNYNVKALYFRNIMAADITGGPANEVLFGAYQLSDPDLSGTLFCFSSGGDLLWQVKTGKPMTFGGVSYHGHFRINYILVDDFLHNGEKQILVHTMHTYDFPSRLLLISSKGVILGQYWNSGRIKAIEAADLNGDGIKEIIAGGENNEYQAAFLVVLDPRHMQGASPQDPRGNYYSDEPGPGREKYYLRFPLSVFHTGRVRDTIYELGIQPGMIQAHLYNENVFQRQKPMLWCGLYEYEFDYRLQCTAVKFTDSFLDQHETIFGKPLPAGEEARVRAIQYWDGAEWTDKPAMNTNWKDNHP